MKTNKKNKQKGPRRDTRVIMVRTERPPQYNAVQVQRKHYRFIFSDSTYDVKASGSNAVAVITAAKLGALESIAETASTLVQLFEAIRLRRVKMWTWADQSSSSFTLPSSISLSFEGEVLGVQGNHITKSDTTTSTAEPAVIDFRLNDKMQAGQWQTTNTNVGNVPLFQISGAANSVIDIWLDVKATRNNRTANNITTTIGGTATPSGYYYLPLDNNAGGTGSAASKILADFTLVTTS